jgi:hypothetical protein
MLANAEIIENPKESIDRAMMFRSPQKRNC